jgi:hypothetical protein
MFFIALAAVKTEGGAASLMQFSQIESMPSD